MLSRPELECARLPAQYPCLVAEARRPDSRIPGHPLRFSTETANEPEECEILNLAVVPVARRLGIATALLNHLFRPGTRYFLEVRESNCRP